jgi:hypothetical protein
VEADGQSSRSLAARLEECAQAGVDEPGVEETDAHRRRDRHSRPVVRPAALLTVQVAATKCADEQQSREGSVVVVWAAVVGERLWRRWVGGERRWQAWEHSGNG